MHNTLNYYKEFKEAVIDGVKKQKEIQHEEHKNTIILKITPNVVLNMIDDIIELIETTERGKLSMIDDLFIDIVMIDKKPAKNTSKKQVYDAVYKLQDLLCKLKI